MNKRRNRLPLITLATLVMMNATAQIDRTQAPDAGPAPKVALQEAETFKLENGLTVIVVENHKLPKVDIQMKFDIPPLLQGELAGYQALMGDMLASGTRRFTKGQIDELADGAGSRVYTGSDGVYLSTLKKSFDPMLRLVHAITVSATFPPQEFEKEKTRLASSIKAGQDDPDAISSNVAKALTYRKGHPYGEITTMESVEKIERKHLYAYYQRFFTPELGYLVFVGDITTKEARVSATKYFGTWKGSEVERVTDANGDETVKGLGMLRYAGKQPQPSRDRLVCFVDKPGATQSIVKVLFPVDLQPDDERLMAAVVMNTILGGGVFNARLMQNLREDKAYTYGAYSRLGNDRYIGSWSGGASVRNEVTREAVGQVIYEMKRIREEEVSADELELAKNYLAGQFGRSLEDPRTVARFELNKAINGLQDDHYTSFLERLDSVSVQDVYKAANDFITVDRATIFVVGDKEEVANSLKGFSARQAVLFYDKNGDLYREKTELPPSDLSANKVLEDYVTAIGGVSRLDAVRDLKITMSGSMGDKEVKSVTMKARPDLYKTETTLDGRLIQQMIYDGTRAVQTDDIGYPKELDKDIYDIDQLAWLFPESKYAEMDNRITLSGSVEIAGEKAWKLTIQTVNGNMIFEYYSAESGLKLKRMERQLTDNGILEVTTYFKDYREVDGIMFPHLIKQSAGLNFTLTVDAIEVNKGIGSALFSIDE